MVVKIAFVTKMVSRVNLCFVQTLWLRLCIFQTLSVANKVSRVNLCFFQILWLSLCIFQAL